MYENNSNNPNSAVMRDIFRPGGRKDVRFSDQTKIIRLLAQSATSGRRARLRSPPSSVFLRAFLGLPGLVDLVGKPPTARINLVMHRHLVTYFRSITLVPQLGMNLDAFLFAVFDCQKTWVIIPYRATQLLVLISADDAHRAPGRTR